MNKIDIQGFYVPTKDEAYLDSIFAEVMNQDSINVLNWAVNVAQKAYDKGMVPNYIERNKTENILDDDDYVDFWSAICIIYGYITNLVRILGLENATQPIMFRYLEQRAMFNCPEQLLVDLLHITEYYYSQIKERGTEQLYKKKVDGKTVDGELLRIFCYSELQKDEFVFTLKEPFQTGWVLNRNSPMYKGYNHHDMSNKGYEPKSISSILNYPTIGSPTIITDGGGQVISMAAGTGVGAVNTGIGGSNNAFNIRINPGQAYEVSFLVKGAGTLTFGALGFDVNDVAVDFINISDGFPKNNFVENLTLQRTDVYIKVKGIFYVHDQSTPLNLPFSLNLNTGNNLKMQATHRSFIPQIFSSSGTLLVKDIKVTPLRVLKSGAFIHSVNHIDVFAVNRNKKLSIQEIKNSIIYYLLPYKSLFLLNLLPNFDDPDVPVVIDGTGFLLNKEQEGVISGNKLMKYEE